MSYLVGCAQSAATSSNLQLWSVISIQEPERREQLAKLCGDQNQIRKAAWYLTFFADTNRIRRAAESVGESASGLDYVEFYTMAVIDAALAAERLVCAAEALGLGICYIGGLRNHPAELKELLKLPEGVFGVFGLCLGWPDPAHPAEVKPRFSQDQVWFREEYKSDLDASEYDQRMVEFYESQKMNAGLNWSMRSGKRVGEGQLTGREVLKSWLESQGFNHR
jgi:nitroreductase